MPKNRRRLDLTENVKDAVVRDYIRGDKAIIIQMEHKTSPGVMYRILKEREVPLRAPKKLEVNQVETTVEPRKKLETFKATVELKGAPSAVLSYALGLLMKEQIQSFTQEIDRLRELYKERNYGECEFDVYMEVLIERNNLDNISKILRHWARYLKQLPDCQHTRGAILTLETLAEMSTTVYKMQPEWK